MDALGPEQGDSPTHPIWWLVPVVVAATLCVLVGVRYVANPVPDYGLSGAPYIEHLYRLHVVELWQSPDVRGPVAFLARADRAGHSYPPLMHLIYLPLGGAFGHAAANVSWFGAVWYLGLAAAMGWIAWLLTRRSRVAMATTLAVLLVPSLHATATRYYYDLPMTTLLWLCVALVLATRRRRPRLGGVLLGMVWFVVCLVKWTALPFGLFMIAGALLCPLPLEEDAPPEPLGPRATLAGIAGVVLVALIALFLSGSTASLVEMSRTFVVDEAAAARVADPAVGALAGVGSTAWVWLDKIAQIVVDPPTDEAWFFLSRLVVAVLSPALTVLALALVVRGRRHVRGLVLVGIVVVGQGLFLCMSIQYPDERFLLTLAPALVLCAGSAWAGLGPRERWIWAAVSLSIGLAVALDFHLGRPGTHRGLVSIAGLQSSFEQRGWGRADEERPYNPAPRGTVEAIAGACDPVIAAAPLDLAEPPACVYDRLMAADAELLHGLDALCQDDHWWQYRSMLAGVDSSYRGADAATWEYASAGGGRTVIRARRVICGCADLASQRLQR